MDQAGGQASAPSAHDVFEILVREHADMLMATLRAILGADPSADDLFQQTLLVAWRRLPDYDRSRPFGPWLRGIAQRLVLEHYRRGACRPLATDPQVLQELDTRFDEVSARAGDTFREKTSRLDACMQRLPDPMRHAIELAYVKGMMLAQVAKALDSSEEAIKKRVQRARQMLADCIRESHPARASDARPLGIQP
jgi:RNA polymerase sigma-70 factor (ECF subfamily)